MAGKRIIDVDAFRRWKTLWQDYGLPLLQAQQRHGHRQTLQAWPQQAATRLIEAGRRQLEAERVRLFDLLAASRRRLDLFGEPLGLDFGVHRWLAPEREEAYADWLAWILGRMTAQEIADLFDVSDLVEDSVASKQLTRIHREFRVEQGHEGASGRLDVVVEFPGQAALVLELKRGDADSADTAKQEGYFQAMERSGRKCRYRLLVTDATSEEVHHFKLLRYADLCLGLRCWAVIARHDPRGHTFVALVLAFVGAVESNFLDLRVTAGPPSHDTLHHLSAFVEKSA